MSKDAQGVTAGVIVPFAQALITGLLLALAALALWQLYQIRDALRVFWAALAVFTCFAWLGSLAKWRAWVDAMFGLEQPEPTQTPYELRLSLNYDSGNSGDWLDLPTDYARFEQWAAGVGSGASLGENHWTGRAGIYSKSEYHKLLDELERRGIVRRAGRHHAQGYLLTRKGGALCGELARRHAARLSPTTRVYTPGRGILRLGASEREGERQGLTHDR